MKKLLLSIPLAIVLAVTMNSCFTTQLYKETYVIDYSRYANVNFFLSESNSVSFSYTPIGSMFSVVQGFVPLTETQKATPKKEEKKRSHRTTSITSPKTRPVIVYDALDELVRSAVSKEANGVINLRIRVVNDKEHGEGYEITGMAIKRD